MIKTIQQTMVFKNVTSQELYETYMDDRIHAAAIGAPVSLNKRVGGGFKAFGENRLQGTILHLVPGRMIVQTWRSHQQWKADELDSVLVLMFEPAPGGAKIRLVQSGVPGRTFDLFNQGWHERYWKPWKTHFKKQAALKR